MRSSLLLPLFSILGLAAAGSLARRGACFSDAVSEGNLMAEYRSCTTGVEDGYQLPEKGGLDVPRPDGLPTVIANAAINVSLMLERTP